MSLSQFYKPLPDIGLFAKTRSGKDEVFNVIKRMGFNAERVAFGDVMKEKFHETFPLIPKDPKPTRQLITFGQAMRSIDNDVWVRPTLNRKKLRADVLAQASLPVPTFVFTDIRQPNEYEAVKSSGAVMVRVEADEKLRAIRMLNLGEKPSPELFNAPTESFIDTFEADYVIYNNGSISDLEKQVTELIFKIQEKRNDV
jgi:dephospho-CoA kinase